MAKTKSRKKKQQQADFKKVKLKVGKKLTKAQDTNTLFKSRKVVLQNQLRKYDSSDPAAKLESGGLSPRSDINLAVSKAEKQIRKQPILELCQTLKHHNKNVRKEGLCALKLRFSSHLDSISPNLSLLLNSIGPLLYDSESIVRQSLLPVIKLIFDNVTADEIMPHFKLLVAHLVCAMTQLDSSIKVFALGCLEQLLKSYGRLCRTDLDLFHSFLEILDTASGKSVGFLLSEKDKLSLLRQLALFISVMVPVKDNQE